MASSLATIQYICDQIDKAGAISFKKMFGEYLVYCNGKPIFLICDNILYVKMLPEIAAFVKDNKTGHPYNGAKLHHIIENIDDSFYLTDLALALERVTPLPKAKKTIQKN